MTEINNQSARLVGTTVTFNSISENNDTEYRLDFLANTSSGQEREYRVWGTLNRSTRSNRISWWVDNPDHWIDKDSPFNRQKMCHPAAVLADVGQMNFTRIGYLEENLMSLEFTTMGARNFSEDQNSALYLFANGTFILLSAIYKDPTGPGSVLELIELTSIDPPGGMTGSGVAVIISPSMITPADRIVYLNLSEPRVPQPGPRVSVMARPRPTLNQSSV